MPLMMACLHRNLRFGMQGDVKRLNLKFESSGSTAEMSSQASDLSSQHYKQPERTWVHTVSVLQTSGAIPASVTTTPRRPTSAQSVSSSEIVAGLSRPRSAVVLSQSPSAQRLTMKETAMLAAQASAPASPASRPTSAVGGTLASSMTSSSPSRLVSSFSYGGHRPQSGRSYSLGRVEGSSRSLVQEGSSSYGLTSPSMHSWKHRGANLRMGAVSERSLNSSGGSPLDSPHHVVNK